MLLKAARLYRLTEVNIDCAKFEDVKARDCTALELGNIGLVNPITKSPDDNLCLTDGSNLVLCVRNQEKVIPSACVNQEVDKRVSEIHKTQGRMVNRKEKQGIKDDVVDRMRKTAFVKNSYYIVVISTSRKLIVINSSSAARCEDALAVLRSAQGSLPVVPISANSTTFFTDWVKNNASAPFEVQSYARWKGINSKATFDGKLIDMEECWVDKVELGYKDDLYFRIDDSLTLSKISYGGMITDREESVDDPELNFLATITVSVNTIICMLDDLSAVTGIFAEEDDEEQCSED